MDMEATERSELPVLDDLIPPFIRKPGESRLSAERKVEKEETDARRSRLVDLLDELARLRQLMGQMGETIKWHKEREDELISQSRRAAQEHEAALLEVRDRRHADVAFLLQVIFAAGQLGALSRDGGTVKSYIDTERVGVTLLFDRVEFAADSADPTRVEVHGDVLTRWTELHDTGLDYLQLAGLAQIFAWTGALPKQDVRDSPQIDTPPPQPAPQPDPLRQLLATAGEQRYSIHLQPE